MKNALTIVFFLMLGSAFVLEACGPVESTHTIVKADTALHNAKTAGAPESKNPEAIYHYTAAKEYLHKAREEWGTSDFEYSIDFARKALLHATAAREKAMKSGDDD